MGEMTAEDRDAFGQYLGDPVWGSEPLWFREDAVGRALRAYGAAEREAICDVLRARLTNQQGSVWDAALLAGIKAIEERGEPARLRQGYGGKQKDQADA